MNKKVFLLCVLSGSGSQCLTYSWVLKTLLSLFGMEVKSQQLTHRSRSHPNVAEKLFLSFLFIYFFTVTGSL